MGGVRPYDATGQVQSTDELQAAGSTSPKAGVGVTPSFFGRSGGGVRPFHIECMHADNVIHLYMVDSKVEVVQMLVALVLIEHEREHREHLIQRA
jgi:hypothetical protein